MTNIWFVDEGFEGEGQALGSPHTPACRLSASGLNSSKVSAALCREHSFPPSIPALISHRSPVPWGPFPIICPKLIWTVEEEEAAGTLADHTEPGGGGGPIVGGVSLGPCALRQP